jgi:hypothetical protein
MDYKYPEGVKIKIQSIKGLQYIWRLVDCNIKCKEKVQDCRLCGQDGTNGRVGNIKVGDEVTIRYILHGRYCLNYDDETCSDFFTEKEMDIIVGDQFKKEDIDIKPYNAIIKVEIPSVDKGSYFLSKYSPEEIQFDVNIHNIKDIPMIIKALNAFYNEYKEKSK